MNIPWIITEEQVPCIWKIIFIQVAFAYQDP